MNFAALSCLCFLFFNGAFASETEKIVGGINTEISKHPHQVSIRMNGQGHFCGGSIISKRHILTAAHCVIGVMKAPYSNIEVVTGTTMSSGISGKIHRVLRTNVHEGYLGTETSSYKNDIAVLTLKEDIEFDDNTKKIDLPKRNVRIGETGVVTGWGIRKYPSKIVSPILQKADMKIIPAGNCMLYLPVRLYAGQVCAFQKKGVGACSGDSGGPLTVDNQVYGIASWVVPCGVGYPDVYTKVYQYVDWIEKVMDKTV